MIDVSKWFWVTTFINSRLVVLVETNNSFIGERLDTGEDVMVQYFKFKVYVSGGDTFLSKDYKTKNDAEYAMNEFIKKIEE